MKTSLKGRLDEISTSSIVSSPDIRIHDINISKSNLYVLNIDKSYIQRGSHEWAGYASPADKLLSDVVGVRSFCVADGHI